MPETEDKFTIAIEPHPQTRLLLRLFYFIPLAFAEDAKNCIAAYPFSISPSLSQSRRIGRPDSLGWQQAARDTGRWCRVFLNFP